MDTTGMLLLVVLLLLTYLFKKWYQNPLRLIPGPRGYPILGNILSLKPECMHLQLYDIAKEYGAVTRIYVLNTPLVVLNTTDVCLEALVKKGTDFQGRPPVTRVNMLIPTDLVFSSSEDSLHLPMRRLFTKAMKAFGPGIGRLEEVMQDIILDIVDDIQAKDGEAIDIHELANGYICSVLVSMLFGEKHSYNDPTCEAFHQINRDILASSDPVNAAAVFDLFPALLKFKFILSSYQRLLRDTVRRCTDFFQQKIDEAKKDFNEFEIKGCLDYFIQNQLKDLDKSGKPIIDDEALRGILTDFVVAGLESSLSSLSQAFLDLLHNPAIVKQIQAQIDEQVDPAKAVKLTDREKLPLLEAFIYENLRYLSVVPLMVPHMTIRDTEVAGYQIPANTRVLMNSFCASHNPDVYEDPFTFKLERFLDEERKLLPKDHPVRSNLLTFGIGKRQCPGELLAKSRIFLFLASILQKFSIELVGELPDNDVRNYKLGSILVPPTVSVKFIRRQQ